MSAALIALEGRKARLELTIRDTLTAKRNAVNMAKQLREERNWASASRWLEAAEKHAARVKFLGQELRTVKAEIKGVRNNPREEFAPLFFNGTGSRR